MTIVTVIHFVLKLLSEFLLLQLTVDWKSDNMTIAMDKRKVLSVKGKI